MKYLTFSAIAFIGSITVACTNTDSKNELVKLQDQKDLEAKNMAIIRDFYSLLDKQDSVSIEKLVDKDFAMFFGSSENSVRFDQLKPVIKEVYLAFPDYKHEIEMMFASGAYVVCKLNHTGTHSERYMGNKPTGKIISYKGIFIYEIRDGLIKEMHGMEDNLATLIDSDSY